MFTFEFCTHGICLKSYQWFRDIPPWCDVFRVFFICKTHSLFCCHCRIWLPGVLIKGMVSFLSLVMGPTRQCTDFSLKEVDRRTIYKLAIKNNPSHVISHFYEKLDWWNINKSPRVELKFYNNKTSYFASNKFFIKYSVFFQWRMNFLFKTFDVYTIFLRELSRFSVVWNISRFYIYFVQCGIIRS